MWFWRAFTTGTLAASRRAAGRRGDFGGQHLEVVLQESNYRDDAKLTAANNALAANVTVPDSVEAIAEDGNVTLTGMVSYGTERAAAAEAVAGLTGVRNVWNEIGISYGIDPVDVRLARSGGAGPLGAGPGRQRRDGRHQRHGHHADRPCPHLG
jgi:osmotically-inducible protein OsmY